MREVSQGSRRLVTWPPVCPFPLRAAPELTLVRPLQRHPSCLSLGSIRHQGFFPFHSCLSQKLGLEIETCGLSPLTLAPKLLRILSSHPSKVPLPPYCDSYIVKIWGGSQASRKSLYGLNSSFSKITPFYYNWAAYYVRS